MIKVKVKRSKEEVKDFSKGSIVISINGNLVLITDSGGDDAFSGVALVDGFAWKAGYTSTTWQKRVFTPFRGKITITV